MRLPAILLTVPLAFSTAAFPASAEPRAEIFDHLEAGRKQTVLVYGTSLSHGGEWAKEVKRWFDGAYPGLVIFQNASGPGQNSDWALKNLETSVLQHHPSLVFLEFSYNDCVDRFQMPAERGAANLATIVERIRAQDPQTTVVLQTMNTPWDAPNGHQSASIRTRLEAFNHSYRAYAQKHRLPLLDHYPNWLRLQQTDPNRFQTLVPDGSHPNREGSLLVTWPTVKDWLEKTRAASLPQANLPR
ncbi:MAG: hypothetical protein RLZZ244_3182 [Verrucomicrobiota bacterium]|jgi:lysophospholipase L1-like esterase